VSVEGPVTDVTQQVPVILIGLSAVLAPLALLALPAAADDGGDADVSTGVVVVLSAGGAEEKVLEFFRLQHADVAELPGGAVVVKVLRVFNII